MHRQSFVDGISLSFYNISHKRQRNGERGRGRVIRRNQKFMNRVNVLLDFFLIVLSYIFSSWLWLDKLGGDSGNMAALDWHTVLLSGVYALFILLLLTVFGFYNTTRSRRLKWKIGIIFIAVTLAVLFASSLLFLFRLEDFSRGVLFLFYGITLLLLIGKYTFMRLLFNYLRARGYNLKHVIVLGTGKTAAQYAADLKSEAKLGYHIKGFMGPEPGNPPCSDHYLGDFSHLDEVLSSPDIDETVIALDPEEYADIRPLILSCEKNGVKYFVIPFYNDIIPAHPQIETIGKSKLINMRANRQEMMGWTVLKRSFDILVSAAGLLLLSPLLLILAIGVRLSGPGPILFRQTRVGYNRREFQMLKFRSMRDDPETHTNWTQRQDDRRTPFGAFIRRTSLDELPQLWNVLKGDMSLVGPRPELPRFVEEFRETIPFYMVKHQVPPGMTGWAQIHGYRGDTSIAKRIELDLWYIDHWSIGLDLKILFRTLFGGMKNKEE